MTMFFLIKEAVYEHGVFWMGESKEEGIRQADIAAENDDDQHHSWVVYEFVEQTDYTADARHKAIYRTEKPRELI